MKGDFIDDYDIAYLINDSVWVQYPDVTYRIIQHNSKEQYIIARNGNENPSEAGLYTRIDYMMFDNMEPFFWGFCLTDYDAATPQKAKNVKPADKMTPKTGCNGFPFSRMKISK